MSLKRKSLYTSITKALNIVLNFVLQLIITPLILTGLGTQQFGIYTLINKIQGYLALVDLRPSAILRYKLATLQKCNNFKTKKEYVGAAILLSLVVLPIMILLGWLLSLGFQDFFNIPDADASVASHAIIVISIFMGIKSFLGIPEAIIRGNNLEYKTFFVDPIRMLLYGVLVYIFLNKGFGLMGVIIAIICASIFDFILKLLFQIYYLPGYAPLRPTKTKIKEFLGSGYWYMGSSFFSQILNSFDIIILGVIFGMEKVTIYTLSKTILFRISESISIITGGITASVGELIGSHRMKELIQVRKILFRINIILGMSIMSYFIVFNNSFISLWVGSENFIGEWTNIIFCFTAFYVLLVLADEIFINAMQNFKNKTKVVFHTTFIALITSSLLAFSFGLSGIAIGLLIAKIYQWINYEKIINNMFSFNVVEEILKNSKVFIILFITIFIKFIFLNFIISTWVMFIISSIFFLIILGFIIYFFIFNQSEKRYVKKIINIKKNHE